MVYVNDKRLCTILPSLLDEVAGVFHIKAYILSEEYFSNRLNQFTNQQTIVIASQHYWRCT